jgi:hypothetical protein
MLGCRSYLGRIDSVQQGRKHLQGHVAHPGLRLGRGAVTVALGLSLAVGLGFSAAGLDRNGRVPAEQPAAQLRHQELPECARSRRCQVRRGASAGR